MHRSLHSMPKMWQHDNINTQQLPKILFFFLLLLLISIHFYEKGGNVELELTTQIIFPCLLSMSLLLMNEWMNEWMNYSVIAYLLPAQKVVTLAFFIQPSLLKFETIHWVTRQLHNLYHPNLAARSKQQKHVNKIESIHCPENLPGQPTSIIYNLIIFRVGKELST
jgi:membrane-associated HD superfamily phosphohydrolase